MATDTIVVKRQNCSLSNIPNAFSPNGDGINDIWDIGGLQPYPACPVLVYSRYGQLVFKSTGYFKPWDGRQNGTQLPAGTYYYIIDHCCPIKVTG